MEQKPTKPCVKCGAVMFNNKGIGKNGKPYENWRCSACGEIEWVNSFTPKEKQPNEATELLREIRDILKKQYGQEE